MQLEIGTFPVEHIEFGSRTRYQDSRLEVDKKSVLEAVHGDSRIASADLEIACPGESVRIWPVRDVIEPRLKVEGPGVTYPRHLRPRHHHRRAGSDPPPGGHGHSRGLKCQLARRRG